MADPVGFVNSSELLAIDEIQHAPELLLAIKASVDEDPRPGRYLLTGSSRLFGMVAAPDALPGRMETVELWPLSQGELDGEPDGFIDAIFTLGPDLRHESAVTRADYAARIVRGGLPEASSRGDSLESGLGLSRLTIARYLQTQRTVCGAARGGSGTCTAGPCNR
jgi:predicted AAA+ superfamily ATPase